jgi:hypothetical protein
MQARNITSAGNRRQGRFSGFIHLHDLLREIFTIYGVSQCIDLVKLLYNRILMYTRPFRRLKFFFNFMLGPFDTGTAGVRCFLFIIFVNLAWL